MIKQGFLAFSASAMVGCASIGRVSEYQATFADARNYSTAFEMQISVHPSDDTLLIYPRVYVLSGPLVAPPEPGAELIRRVAVEFVGDTGCTIGEIRQMTRPWFEAHFTCPADFDIRSAIAAQREQLRGGATLQR